LGPESIELFLPQSFNLSLVFNFFHSSFLLSHLLNFVLPRKLLQHRLSELHLHPLFLLFLPYLSFSGLSFSVLHLELLVFSFFGLLLLFTSGLSFELFSIKLNSKVFKLLSVSSSFLFLLLKFLENFIFSLFLFFFGHLDSFFSRIQFLQVSHVFLFLLLDQLKVFESLLFFELQGRQHVLESFFLFDVFFFEIPSLAINKVLHDFLDLLFFSEVLFVGLLLFLLFFIHLFL
jgi:hypothetical protein